MLTQKDKGKQTNQNTSWVSFKLPSQSFPVNQSPHSHEYCAGLSEVLLQVPPLTHGLSTSHMVCATKEMQEVQFLSISEYDACNKEKHLRFNLCQFS